MSTAATMDIDTLPGSPDEQFLQGNYKAALQICEDYELEVTHTFLFSFLFHSISFFLGVISFLFFILFFKLKKHRIVIRKPLKFV